MFVFVANVSSPMMFSELESGNFLSKRRGGRRVDPNSVVPKKINNIRKKSTEHRKGRQVRSDLLFQVINSTFVIYQLVSFLT